MSHRNVRAWSSRSDAAGVEQTGQPITRPIDRNKAVVLYESTEDRYDLVCAAKPAVDVEKRRAGAELAELCLALAQRTLGGLERQVQTA